MKDIYDEKYLEYLDKLRKSGVTNMFGASPFLREEFPEVSRQQSKLILSHWMKTLGTEKHDPLDDDAMTTKYYGHDAPLY